MNILTIPLRNTRKKWVKTLLLLTVFTLGVVSIVALGYVSQMVGESLEQKLTAYGANILVTPKTGKLTVSYGGFALGDMSFGAHSLDLAEVERKVESIELKERIRVVAPKLVGMGTVNQTPVGVIGVQWHKEQVLKGYWALDGTWPDRSGQIVAGSKAAETLGLAPGSRTAINGRTVEVSGVLRPTGGDDDGVLFMGLGDAQELFGQPGRASFVEVAALCSGCPIEEITAEISKVLPGTEVQALQSIVKQRMVSVNFVKRLAFIVSLVILFIACCMVGATMLASVNERVREIGLVRSLGFSRKGVFAIFCFEALVIGGGAGVLGYTGGFLLSREVVRALDMAAGATVAFDVGHLFLTTGFIVLVSVLAAFFPAWKASGVEPSEALISL